MLAQEKIELYALIGDLKETLYAQMLVISALHEMLPAGQGVDAVVLERKIEELSQQDASLVGKTTSPHPDV